METTTIRVREPRELLALLPYQLGFQPQDSAVVVSLRPPRGRVGLIARVDLADLGEPAGGPELARRLVTHLVGDGAGRAVLVLYPGHDPRPEPGSDLPGGARPDDDVAQRAVRHLRQAADPFLGEVAAWVVGPTGYRSLDCLDPACCPAGGRPLHELQSTQVGAHMVLAGAMVADSRENLVPDVPASAAARRNATRAAARAAARRAGAEAQGPAALERWRAGALSTWRGALAAAGRGEWSPSAAVLGRLVAALDDAAVRDAVLLTLVPGAGDLAERSMATGPSPEAVGAEVSTALATVVSADGGVPPEDALAAGAAGVLERVVGHAKGPDRAPALTLLGLLAWWRGDGARAAVLVDRALAADPSHRLAELLCDALAAGLAPGWVRAAPRPQE